MDLVICARCGGKYNSVYEENGYFPALVVDQLTLQEKLVIWKDLGGFVWNRKDKKTTLNLAEHSRLNLNHLGPQDQSEKGSLYWRWKRGQW